MSFKECTRIASLPILTLLLPEALVLALFRFLGGTPLLQQICWHASLSLHE